MENYVDAVIMGAGPAGSSAAILLASAGWSVALVEKQPFPRRKVCGECLAASNMPLLRALGIGSDLERRAGPELRHVAFMRGSDIAIAQLPPATHSDFRWGRALGREMLDTLLLERARATGVQVLQPWSVERIMGGPGAWRCAIREVGSEATATVFAPVIVDAHGSWQPLPLNWTETRRPHRASDLLAFKANFTGTSLAQGLLPVFSLAGGYGGMVVADAGLTTLACCIRRDRLDRLRNGALGLRAGDAVEAMLKRECAGVRAALEPATRQGPWIAAGPLNTGVRVNIDDGLFRIGNAAGEAHPILGEGLSMALQSSWLLGTELLGREYIERSRKFDDVDWQRATRRRYARKWQRQFALRICLASAFAHASMNATSAATLLALFRIWPALLPLGATLGGKTRCAVESGDIASLTALLTSSPGSHRRSENALEIGLQSVRSRTEVSET